MELNQPDSSQLILKINDLKNRADNLIQQFNIKEKKQKISQIDEQLQDPSIWKNLEKTRTLNEEKSEIIELTEPFETLPNQIEQADFFLNIAVEENDIDAIKSANCEIQQIEKVIHKLEFQRMFAGKMDSNNAYLDIQAGSGGTEAQDWAEMLFRMYLRFFDRKNFKYEIIEVSEGDVAGIKSASVHIKGSYVYGWLKTELGIHRLVRKSPFDANHKRHTSFASVFISPEIDDSIEIEINPSDLRIDTYRSSGAGGQHVNKTDSAVRITHLPTNTVVQCQNGRSQHANKDTAMKQLRAALYEKEMQTKRAEQEKIEKSKSDVGWGSQIRSYVLDQSRIKDLRTGFESSNPVAVLDGDLEGFIEESLKQGVVI